MKPQLLPAGIIVGATTNFSAKTPRTQPKKAKARLVPPGMFRGAPLETA
jgi:hypothetical protein